MSTMRLFRHVGTRLRRSRQNLPTTAQDKIDLSAEYQCMVDCLRVAAEFEPEARVQKARLQAAFADMINDIHNLRRRAHYNDVRDDIIAFSRELPLRVERRTFTTGRSGFDLDTADVPEKTDISSSQFQRDYGAGPIRLDYWLLNMGLYRRTIQKSPLEQSRPEPVTSADAVRRRLQQLRMLPRRRTSYPVNFSGTMNAKSAARTPGTVTKRAVGRDLLDYYAGPIRLDYWLLKPLCMGLHRRTIQTYPLEQSRPEPVTSTDTVRHRLQQLRIANEHVGIREKTWTDEEMGLISKAIMTERPLSYKAVREIANGNARVLALLTEMIETNPDIQQMAA